MDNFILGIIESLIAAVIFALVGLYIRTRGIGWNTRIIGDWHTTIHTNKGRIFKEDGQMHWQIFRWVFGTFVAQEKGKNNEDIGDPRRYTLRAYFLTTDTVRYWFYPKDDITDYGVGMFKIHPDHGIADGYAIFFGLPNTKKGETYIPPDIETAAYQMTKGNHP